MRNKLFMNEEFLVNLAEAMLNEGIDEDRIINILSNLVEDEQEERVLPVSESCYNDIISLTEAIIATVTNEGIMDDIKAGMDPEKAKKKWVKQKNAELVDAVRKENNLRRLNKKEFEKSKKGEIPYINLGPGSVYHKMQKAADIANNKIRNNIKLNYRDNKATEGKMVRPSYDEKMNFKGFEKGDKPYKPKKD